MTEQAPLGETAVFEHRFAELLRAYARADDRDFDAVEITAAASAAARPASPWSGQVPMFGSSARTALALIALLALLSALVAGTLVVGGPPTLPAPDIPAPAVNSGPRFAPEEILVSRDNQVVATNIVTGAQRVVIDGWVLAMSPDRTRFVRATTGDDPDGRADAGANGPGYIGPLAVTTPSGADVAHIPVPLTQFASWSPDGRYVVLEGPMFENSNYAIWDAETGALTYLPFTRHVEDFIRPTWAPDSRHLTVLDQGRSLITDIHGAVRQDVGDGLAFLSPDATYILRETHRIWPATCCLTLLSVNPDFTTSTAVEVPFVHYPSWSPDGRHYAGISNDGLTVVGIDDLDHPRIVYRGTTDPNDPRRVHEGQFVEWSLDGRELAFVGPDPADDTRTSNAVIVVNLESGSSRVLTSFDSSPFDW